MTGRLPSYAGATRVGNLAAAVIAAAAASSSSLDDEQELDDEGLRPEDHDHDARDDR